MEELLSRIPKFATEFLREIFLNYAASRKVENISGGLRKIDNLTQTVKEGAGKYRQVEDHVFELKVISYIRDKAHASRIIYEPTGIDESGKRCDLIVRTDQKQYLIELKSFHPDDRETEIPTQHVAKNNVII